eukprot:gene12305-15464_t
MQIVEVQGDAQRNDAGKAAKNAATKRGAKRDAQRQDEDGCHTADLSKIPVSAQEEALQVRAVVPPEGAIPLVTTANISCPMVCLQMWPWYTERLFHAYCYKMAHSSFADDLTLAEEKHTMLAQYYGNVQVLSARSALYDIVSSSDVAASSGVIYQRDIQHLSERGHRWYADIFINYFRHVVTNLVLRAVGVQLGRLHHLSAEGIQEILEASADDVQHAETSMLEHSRKETCEVTESLAGASKGGGEGGRAGEEGGPGFSDVHTGREVEVEEKRQTVLLT